MAAIMLEAAKRAREGEDPREFILYFRKPLRRLPGWQQPAIFYTLKPKPKLRPWTAWELANKVGNALPALLNVKRKDTGQRFTIAHLSLHIAEGEATIWLHDVCGASVVVAAHQLLDEFTQLDGSPCGEWEEVQP